MRIFRQSESLTWGAYLLTRLISVVLVGWLGAPYLVADFYAPFVQSFLNEPSLDPWTSWIEAGGEASAFPYGWPMLAGLSLAHVMGGAAGAPWLGFFAVSLLLDFIAFTFLRQAVATSNHANSVLLVYALSPLPIASLAVIGSNDYLAMALLLASFLFLRKGALGLAGSMIGLAVGVKMMLGVALLVMFLFLWRSGDGKRKTLKFTISAAATTAISLSPALYSEGFLFSLLRAEGALGPLTWGIESPNGNIQLLPILLVLVIYAMWRWRRMNVELLLLGLVVPLLLLANLPGASLGWSLWAMPLLLALVAGLPRRYLLVASIATNSQVVVYLLELAHAENAAFDPALIEGLSATAALTLAVGASALLWEGVVSKSDFLRLRGRPALILISGDSGVGKDTLADGLTSALGKDSTVRVSGDDYHLWDRGNKQWAFMTHLNPAANELAKFFNDILELVGGKQIEAGQYDHRIGRRISSRTAASREFVVASGLHALWSRDLNRLASLRVFLEMQDELRIDLKIARDVSRRGHSREAVIESLAKREVDSASFITPQSSDAQLIIRTEYDDGPKDVVRRSLKVTFRYEAKLFDDNLLTELTNTCGLEVSSKLVVGRVRELVVRGESTSELLELAFSRLEPRVSKVIGSGYSWDDGLPGVIQMVTMVHLSHNLRIDRLIN